jgi:branched-chain amino acid transport system permease protein
MAAPSAAGADAPNALKESLIAAALTVLLCTPIILMHAEADNDGVLYVIWRPWVVALFALIAFAGRFAVLSYGGGKRSVAAPAIAAPAVAAPGALRQEFARFAPMFGLAFLLLFPLGAIGFLGNAAALKWIDSYGIQILIYVMLGWGLNIVVGLAGLLDLGYVAFYAVGAYAYALLATTFGLSFWICLPLAGILASLWGLILGFPVLRLRGDYLAIVTLAFGEIIRTILVNWTDFSGGTAGIASIPKITFFGLRFADSPNGFDAFFGMDYAPIHGKIFLYYVILALALITNGVTLRLRQLPIGRAWEALREDEIACRSLGLNTRNTKLTAFALGAFFGGLAGSFFAVRQGFISPESFTFSESATILAIVVLGGMGSQIGVAFAAAALVGGFELLRQLDWLKYLMQTYAGVPDFDPIQYRGLLFGLAMVVMMVFRPRGFVSTRTPSIFLKERKAVSGDLVAEGHG